MQERLPQGATLLQPLKYIPRAQACQELLDQIARGNSVLANLQRLATIALVSRESIQRYWCEHKPSVTISVEEKDWPSVGAWTWEHFDEISGVSYLPYDGGTYRQAPYEECTEDEYNALKAKMPTINWSELKENTDNVEGAQQLACVAGVCEI